MSKVDQEAFAKILSLIDDGALVQIEKVFNGYEVTVWPNKHDHLNHSHFQGESLIKAVFKATK